jgi:hypothetical protein
VHPVQFIDLSLAGSAPQVAIYSLPAFFLPCFFGLGFAVSCCFFGDIPGMGRGAAGAAGAAAGCFQPLAPGTLALGLAPFEPLAFTNEAPGDGGAGAGEAGRLFVRM